MTTTSQPMRTRPPQPSPEPAGRPMTFGRPRRTRRTHRTVGLAALAAVPLALGLGIGAVVIHGYNSHLHASAAGGPGTGAADAGPDGAAGTEAAPNDHAPTGPDVGTQGLNPQLTRAITLARAAAAADNITIDIVSGYRSAATQQRLFEQAVAKYGSAAEASKWVLPPEKSHHVSGSAIDVGPYQAAMWLKKNGVKFGLCQAYANEYWHFEVLAPATGQKCPAPQTNAASGG